jgi:FHA domain-containing protein
VVKPRLEAPPAIPRPSAPIAPPTQPVSVGPAGPQEQALLRAFLHGAGISGIQSKSLTPEAMEAIGKLLREAVQGTLDLLRARGLTKSEMRADVTMIMAQDNNPLKFSPTVEAALTHLLSSQVHGFMPPLRAMKDAYDDLRAHQLGFLAGMRAALEEVLARFAPQELAKRLTEQSMLDDLLPMNRKAKLWDLFLERHAAISGEAREDFNAAFGKAFRRAYEAQVKQLRGDRS